MKIEQAIRFMPLLLILIFQSGCMTHALWTNGDLDSFNDPAQNPNLHLFAASQRKDFLVVYDEFSERHSKIQTRAYWLNENELRIKKNVHRFL
ncbi:MAG TPA: hypothetical protein VFV23_11605 [Verrucomicrobiae bacterium]|nr:hypothetical protein [Verrucomicrobiae bacterium]